ncbi:polynucleotidyl transferase, ribonuclease H-like superfamily protein [Actinidia rufa]|uniref:Polynucleotidyl transferase, ribonuclease H-like superfamily protein n=1 Tax=Actinidia rufa TaxID=165716 RepID=A0A7J0GP56_9ERIC|nr:polynucleotidyl transferase, ribonuclease H-like superfamily protein [Actinidia rufa]
MDDPTHLEKFNHNCSGELEVNSAKLKQTRCQQLDFFLVLDLEGKVEILEFPVLMLDAKTMEVVDIFHRFVRPSAMSEQRINEYIEGKYGKLGVDRVWHDTAIPFEEVIQQFEAWMAQHHLWGKELGERLRRAAFVTCGNWDLKTKVPQQCKVSRMMLPTYFLEWINLKDIYLNFYKRRATGMITMMKELQIPLVGSHHLGIDDTKNIARVLQHMLTDGALLQITARRNPEDPENVEFLFKNRIRLVAICEKAYNRNQRGAKTESNDFVGGGLRKEWRWFWWGKRKDGVKVESPCSTSRDVEEEPGSWRSRLRSRARNAILRVREKKGLSPRGKRKLFENFYEISEEVKVKDGDFDGKEEELKDGLSTIVKRRMRWWKRENNVVEEHNGINEVEVLEENGGKVPLDLNSEAGCEGEHVGEDDNTTPLIEKEEMKFQWVYELKIALMMFMWNYWNRTQVKDGAFPEKPLEDENTTKVDKTGRASSDTLRKMRVRVGRRCGLCGTGTYGKPPKKLLQDGAGIDHEAYSGSSASEEPNYDQWDRFGDEPGWIGRLLVSINDRHGIAGIWVRQHCAVWSPETLACAGYHLIYQ